MTLLMITKLKQIKVLTMRREREAKVTMAGSSLTLSVSYFEIQTINLKLLAFTGAF